MPKKYKPTEKVETKEKTKEELIAEIERLENELKRKKKYGLVWEEKPEEVVDMCKKKLPIVKEVKSKEIITDKNKPVNLLIEGDNYHALSVLNYTHEKKIDVIYIDPPYNTGSDEFKYNDKRVDKEDRYRHSKWISFMAKRLRVARDLLKDSGVIFISINEEELSQLKLLCDEIYRQHNYLTTFTVRVSHEDRILKGDKDFHEVVEYLLLYRRSKKHKTAKRLRDNVSIAEYVYEIEEMNENPEKIQFGSKFAYVFRPGEYKILKKEPEKSRLKKINIRGSIKEGNSSGRFYMRYLDPLGDRIGYLYKVDNIGNDGLGYRYFLMPTSSKKINGDYFQGVPVDRKDTKEFPYPNYLDFESEFNNVGYEGGIDFRNGKKPIDFILKILEMGGAKRNPNAIILDFFAGSGSTGHAVLDLNKEDQGSRMFILCTNNEVDKKTEENLRKEGYEQVDRKYEAEGVCQKVCYPRMKNVLLGYEDSRKNKFEGLGGNLKYFKTDFVDAEPTDKNKKKLTEQATGMLCIKEGTFEPVLDKKDFKIFKNISHYTGIIFDQLAIPEFKKAIKDIKGNFSVYVFSLSDETFDEEFTDVKQKIKLSPIPEAILRVYRRILR